MPTPAELADLRQPLLRYALLQLRNASLAEDVVSEVMLALLEKPLAFEGRSSLRTYATGILKFKIIDAIRTKGREVPIDGGDEHSVDDALDALFAQDGHWAEPPAAWPRPDRALENSQFQAALQRCLQQLPAKTGRAFMMREWLERDVEDICAELGITANHCGVLLFRARLTLRECLGQGWFAGAR